MTPTPLAQTGTPGDKKVWHAGTLTYTAGGLALLFFWLLWGDFSWQLKERSVPAVMQVLLKKFDSSDTLAAVLMGSLASFLSMVLVPIVSYNSDRHRGKWGRRIPYLLIPTPFVVLAMAGLAFSPELGPSLDHLLGARSPGPHTCVLICLGLFWTLFELATITANAVVGGLINDVVPRELLGRFFGAFRALSLIAAMIFNYGIIGYAKTSYVWIFLGMGLLYGLGFTLMCLKVKEGDYPAVPAQTSERRTWRSLWLVVSGYFKECFGHSYYWWYYLAMALSWITFVPINLYSIFFSQSVNLSLATYGKCLFFQFFISLALSYPLGALADRIHPLRLGIAIQVLFFVVVLSGGLLIHDGASFSIALVTQGVLAGSWMTATASISQRLLPKAEFTQFAAAGGILHNLGSIVAGPLIGVLLDHTQHQYRYTYLCSAVIVLGALCLNLVVHRKFMALGGPNHYVAPYVVNFK